MRAASLTGDPNSDMILATAREVRKMVKPSSGYEWLLPEMIHPTQDWILSPKAMQRYLQYHLYMIEHRIAQLSQTLEQQSVPIFSTNLEDESVPEDLWETWAALNYLLRARTTIAQALRPSRHKIN